MTIPRPISFSSFGSVISEMQYSNDTGNGYRYGFNGKEMDDETELQDYGFRIYNPAICKFLSFDPLAKKYPELTPYQFASNTPICAIDLDGLEMFYATVTEHPTEKGKLLVTITLDADKTVDQQRKAGMGKAVASINGEPFSRDFKYCMLQDYFASAFFDNEGSLWTIVDGKKELLKGKNPNQVGGYERRDKAPEYSEANILIPNTETTIVETPLEVELGNFTWGTATSDSKELTYSSELPIAQASLKYNLGSADYPLQTWDLSITNENTGEVILSLTGQNTGGTEKSIDLTSMLPKGDNNFKINITPSATSVTPPSTGGASVSTDFTATVSVTTKNVSTVKCTP